jgi:hypothetical protein
MIKEAITIRYLSGHDVAALALDNDEILDAIEASLRAQPISLFTSETSGGLEDYMSMAIPAYTTLYR